MPTDKTHRSAGRRSALAGAHPAASTARPEEINPSDHPPRQGAGRSVKTTLTVSPDVLDDAKNGYWVAMKEGKHITFAEYVTAALRAYNEMIRQELAGGQEFPVRPMHKLPTTHLS